MRAFVRGLVAFPLLALAACTQSVSDEPEGDEVATESTAEALAVTSTPGKAAWTKVWRWASYRNPTLATDVATDETGAAFVTRTRQGDNLYGEWADVTRYTTTGAMSYRITLDGYTTIIPDSLQVAARGGRLVTTVDRGSSSMVTVFDAGSGNLIRHLPLGSSTTTGTTGRVFIKDVAVHDDGGFVVLARVVGDIDWGTGLLSDPDPNTTDMVVARFDDAGNLITARRFDATYAQFVSLDGNGAIYVGSKGHLTAPTTQTNWGVSKLTRSLLISDSFFLEGDATITAMDVSRGGRITFGGSFAGGLRVGPDITLQESNAGSEPRDSYAVKLDTNLDAAYAIPFGSSAGSHVRGIGMDSYGQVVLAMDFSRDLTFDGTTYTASGDDTQMAMVKLHAVGLSARWTKIYGATGATPNYVRPTALAITDTDRILVTGEFRTDVDFGRGTIDGSSAGTAFLARFYQ